MNVLPVRVHRVCYAKVGDKCIMLACEFKSVPLGMQGDNCLDNPAHFLSYVVEKFV